MGKRLNQERYEEELKKNSKNAEELLENEDKLEKFLERLEKKIAIIPKVGPELASVPMLISLVRAYVKKEYTDIPIGSIIAIISALIYFLSPIDLLPDAIPAIGFVDDVGVIYVALKLIASDIQEYENWQIKNGKRILEDNTIEQKENKDKENEHE